MSKAGSDDMRDHYDFSRGVCGKYTLRYAEGTNLVKLDRDVTAVDRDDTADLDSGDRQATKT